LKEIGSNWYYLHGKRNLFLLDEKTWRFYRNFSYLSSKNYSVKYLFAMEIRRIWSLRLYSNMIFQMKQEGNHLGLLKFKNCAGHVHSWVINTLLNKLLLLENTRSWQCFPSLTAAQPPKQTSKAGIVSNF
jgi:hypothetical protein